MSNEKWYVHDSDNLDPGEATRDEVYDVALSESEVESRFDEMLDDMYGTVEVAGLTMDTSVVLKECDPIAYRCSLSDYMSEYTEVNPEEFPEELPEDKEYDDE